MRWSVFYIAYFTTHEHCVLSAMTNRHILSKVLFFGSVVSHNSSWSITLFSLLLCLLLPGILLIIVHHFCHSLTLCLIMLPCLVFCPSDHQMSLLPSLSLHTCSIYHCQTHLLPIPSSAPRYTCKLCFTSLLPD